MVLKFSDETMSLLREERGLVNNDISEDKYINQYSINEAYKKLLKFGNYNNFNVEITSEFLELMNSRIL